MVPLRDLVLCWATRNSSRFSLPLTANLEAEKDKYLPIFIQWLLLGWREVWVAHLPWSVAPFQMVLMSRLPQDTRDFVVLTYCGNDVIHLGLQVLFTLQEFGNQQLQGRILHNDLMSDW